MEKAWDDERSNEDAPVWMSAEEAGAWSMGYNAAVIAAKMHIENNAS